MLFNTSQYITLHQKANKISTPFNLILLGFQIITISLFLYLCWNTFGWQSNFEGGSLFLIIMASYGIVVICKVLIEKIIGTIFALDHLIEDYVFHKMSYRNFLGLILFPIIIIFVYGIHPSKNVLYAVFLIIMILNLIILFPFYKKNENIILNHIFYFILYLCALEIAPYFILYKLIK